MIAIIDYKAGNLKSVERALSYLGFACRVTADRAFILEAERIIFPGVGAAGTAMETLVAEGLDETLRRAAAQGKPFLGICLGAQVILEGSEEGPTDCLGLIPGRVRRFQLSGLRIPHMGWNHISVEKPHPILHDLHPQAQYYFVHSYFPAPEAAEEVIATTDYGVNFASVLGRGNVVATQFHPEKSGAYGLKILRNFCTWDGRWPPC